MDFNTLWLHGKQLGGQSGSLAQLSTPPGSIQPFSEGAKCFATSGNTFSLSALFLPLTPFFRLRNRALVLYYWNVWLWLVQQMKRLNANVWFPRGPPCFMGCRCLQGEEEGFLSASMPITPCIVCIFYYSSWQVNTSGLLLKYFFLRGLLIPPITTATYLTPPPPCPWGVWDVKISQALNMRNVGSTRTSPWLCSSE